MILELKGGGNALIDDKYYNDLGVYNWQIINPDDDKHYVAMFKASRWLPQIILLHRCVMSLKLGRPIERHEWVDHIDRDTLNCLEDNLRLCTPSQNSQNQAKRSTNTTGYKGVDQLKSGRFRAQITADWLYKYLGTHATAEEAARAYDKAARKYHKEFAVLNFPDEPFE